MRLLAAGLAGLLALSGAAQAQTVLRASVLPNSRAAETGETVSVFATMLNSGETALENCSVALDGADPWTIGYQRTDAGNAPIGDANTPFSIPAGEGQSLVLTFSAASAAAGDEVRILYACDGASAAVIPGVNTVFLTASDTAPPDIIPILSTLSGDGVMRVATEGGRSRMAAAAINIGPAADIDVRAVAPFLPNNVALEVCETDPGTGACTSARAESVRVNFAEDETRTFTIFADVADEAGIPNLPAVSRIYLLFNGVAAEADAVNAVAFPTDPPVYGASSAAARAPFSGEGQMLGVFRGLMNGEPVLLVSHSITQPQFGTLEGWSSGASSAATSVTGADWSNIATGYADGEYLPSAGIGFGEGAWAPQSFLRGQYRSIDGSVTYDYQTVWDPITTTVLYPDDIPEGDWAVFLDGASIGQLTVDTLGNISGDLVWPGADGEADGPDCDTFGVTGGGGALGYNIAGWAINQAPCGPNFFLFGYFEDTGSDIILRGHAGKQGSRDGTPDFMYLELVRQ